MARMTEEANMTAWLVDVVFDANDPMRLAQFWAEALRWGIGEETDDEVALVPTDDTGFGILFGLVPERKTSKNRIHFDLTTTSLDDQTTPSPGSWRSVRPTWISVKAPTRTMLSWRTRRATSSASSSRATTSSLGPRLER